MMKLATVPKIGVATLLAVIDLSRFSTAYADDPAYYKLTELEDLTIYVLLSMVYPFDPAWRGLVHGPGLGMWTFHDDYPRRVGDAVYEAVPNARSPRPSGP